ncbi:MAG: hypothetical protein ACR2IF_00625 [Terriglobales bacterium]
MSATTKEQIKAELNAVLDQGSKLVPLVRKGALEFGAEYQEWYTKALPLVRTLAPDRLDEFRAFYEPAKNRKTIDIGTYKLQDYIVGLAPTSSAYRGPAFNHVELALSYVFSQQMILKSLASRIDGVLADLEAAVAVDIEDAELATAESLRGSSLRAAGALTGVILERHLRRVVTGRGISVGKKNPTLADLNDALKKSSVYDLATFRKVQFLADIRNMCAHAGGSEPSAQQIDELIAGVKFAVKNIS